MMETLLLCTWVAGAVLAVAFCLYVRDFVIQEDLSFVMVCFVLAWPVGFALVVVAGGQHMRALAASRESEDRDRTGVR